MRKLRFMVVGMGFLSLFSCTKTSQYVVDKYVEEENKKLPISLTEYMSYDSIKCDKNDNNVIMYYALKNELIIEAVKSQDNEVTKRVLICKGGERANSHERRHCGCRSRKDKLAGPAHCGTYV